MRALIVAGLCAMSLFPAAAQDKKPDAAWGPGPDILRIATGSPGELGLLEKLATDFAANNHAAVHWFKAGSGQAMGLLKARAVDMILAHAPAAERKAVADGWATGRQIFGSNEFWIVGPAEDPARIAAAADAADAFRRIHAKQAKTITRADHSGTHQKEMEIWKLTGLQPHGDWYIPTRDFMAASLHRANAEKAYFLTDSSTFVAERSKVPNLKILFRGGAVMMNPYHTLWLKDPVPGTPLAEKFARYLLSAETQAVLRSFGQQPYGEAMYNDAAVSRQRWPADQ